MGEKIKVLGIMVVFLYCKIWAMGFRPGFSEDSFSKVWPEMDLYTFTELSNESISYQSGIFKNFIRLRIATSVIFGRKWYHLIPQNANRKCHTLCWLLMKFLKTQLKNILKIWLFHSIPCKKWWNLSTISSNKNQIGAEL